MFTNIFNVKNTHYFKVVILSILFLFSILLLNNKLQNNITTMHVDEIHTINLGVHSMYSGKVATQRGDITVIVGESTRWLARIIYPVALYYMNTKMGADIAIKGIKYSSGYYIESKLFDTYTINKDANIQDFIFAMKFILGFFVLFSFFIASYFLSKVYGLIAGISYFSFSTSTLLINKMLLIFYTESTMIILFNLILIVALNNHLNKWRLYIWTAFILSFAISTKLTGVIYLLPIIVILFTKDKYSFKSMKIEGFILLTIVLVYLIHIFSWGHLMEVLDQTLVNVYHYKTGHGGHTVASGLNQIKLIVATLSQWIFLFPLSFLFLLYKKPEYKKFLLSIVVSATIMILALIDVHFFVNRNLTTPLVMMLVIISIALSMLTIQNNYKPKFVKIIVAIVIIIYSLLSLNKYYIPINAEAISKYTKECKKIALVDIQKNLFNNATIIEGMPKAFSLKKQSKKLREQFREYDCVVINRIKNNNQYTNYLLPLDYKIKKRLGNFFLFQKTKEDIEKAKKVKELKDKLNALSKKKLLVASKFNIYQDDNKLIFYKLACYDKYIKDDLILNIIPIDKDDSLDQGSINTIKYNALGSNKLIPGTCYFEVPLPIYPYSSITIKQINGTNILWKEKLKGYK